MWAPRRQAARLGPRRPAASGGWTEAGWEPVWRVWTLRQGRPSGAACRPQRSAGQRPGSAIGGRLRQSSDGRLVGGGSKVSRRWRGGGGLDGRACLRRRRTGSGSGRRADRLGRRLCRARHRPWLGCCRWLIGNVSDGGGQAGGIEIAPTGSGQARGRIWLFSARRGRRATAPRWRLAAFRSRERRRAAGCGRGPRREIPRPRSRAKPPRLRVQRRFPTPLPGAPRAPACRVCRRPILAPRR